MVEIHLCNARTNSYIKSEACVSLARIRARAKARALHRCISTVMGIR